MAWQTVQFSGVTITGRRISAWVPMHTFGHPCQINKVVDICRKYHILVVDSWACSAGYDLRIVFDFVKAK
jgi:dTDP-4-amino-4,6-dideoxygalactose transaminase